MVKSVSSFSRNGMRDFLWQRLSAVYMAFFLAGLAAYLAVYQVADFYAWHSLFQHNIMRVLTALCFLLLSLHTQIGLWSVITDYIKNSFMRLILLSLTALILLICVIWGIIILWGL